MARYTILTTVTGTWRYSLILYREQGWYRVASLPSRLRGIPLSNARRAT